MSAFIPGQVQHINPEGLSKNPAFTQVVTVTGPAKTIYIGGTRLMPLGRLSERATSRPR